MVWWTEAAACDVVLNNLEWQQILMRWGEALGDAVAVHYTHILSNTHSLLGKHLP